MIEDKTVAEATTLELIEEVKRRVDSVGGVMLAAVDVPGPNGQECIKGTIRTSGNIKSIMGQIAFLKVWADSIASKAMAEHFRGEP